MPVASYAEAFNHPAQRLDNNTWEWTYQVVVQDTTYTANLFAFIESDGINMEMHISKEGGFQDFVWYTGTFNLQRTEGQWTIQDNPENNVTWLNIMWHHDYEAKTFDIQYTNVYPTGDYKDSFIKYGIRKDNAYDAFYNIYSSPDDKTYEIDFNTTTHEGRIYYESLWHCWDSKLPGCDLPELIYDLIRCRNRTMTRQCLVSTTISITVNRSTDYSYIVTIIRFYSEIYFFNPLV